MTDRQNDDFGQRREPRRTAPPPARDDAAPPEQPTPKGTHESYSGPALFGGNTGGNTGGDDPSGPRSGTGSGPVAGPVAGPDAEPPRGENTTPYGPTPEYGARPGPPPQPPTQQTAVRPVNPAGPPSAPQHARPPQVWPPPAPTRADPPWGEAPPPGRPAAAPPPADPPWGEAPPPGRPGGQQDPRTRTWGEPVAAHQAQNSWGDGGYRGGAPNDYNYVDSIRSSDLVPTSKIPPRRGWRKGVLATTFGLVNLGRSPDERQQDELEAKTRTLLRGRYKIGVLGKGGVGKTTLAASLGSVFAELRQEDRVVAIDADTAFGKLASRIDPRAAGSYWELAADQHLHTFADVRSRVGSNSAGLFVLAGEQNVARRRVLDPAIYREATSRLDNHFTISIIDCGSTMDAPVTREVLADLDALLVVSSPWIDGASAAGQTLEWLANNGYTGLLHRTVVVLNDSDGHADKRTRTLLADEFGKRGQVVVSVPFDPHLRPGGLIDVDEQISSTTRRRLLEIAAAIAEHFASTTDGPRERR